MLQKLSYNELKMELCIAYYSCDHDYADLILDEMKTRNEYYED